jgi:hypothetical protein
MDVALSCNVARAHKSRTQKKMLFVLVALAFASDAISISAGEQSINLFAGQIVQQLNSILSGETWPQITGSADDLNYELNGL